jgi:site-specific DNA-cytosine methylase
MAEAVCHFLRVLTPETFTLENVRGYRRSCSYRLICDTLDALDYWFTSQVLNAADTGVSQTRERLFIIACREGFPPPLPTPTPWTGWYAAIEDLLPTLPESRFAPWQLKRLPEYLMSFLHPHTTADGSTPVRGVEEPAFAIQSTISKAISKAFIVEGSAAGEDNKFNLPVRKADEPVFTMRGSQNNPRAFLVDCQNNGNAETAGERGLTNRQSAEPSHTITGSQNKRTVRAWLEQGRVVIMTPRALGRFQSLPDWYELPTGKGANKVACVVIGNGVPCRLMETILRGLT